MLLLLQWIAAHGQCHALHTSTIPPGWAVCTAHAAAAAPDRRDETLHADWTCPACHAAQAVADVPTSLLPPEPIAWEALALVPRPHAPGALGARAPPPPARGPPAAR